MNYFKYMRRVHLKWNTTHTTYRTRCIVIVLLTIFLLTMALRWSMKSLPEHTVHKMDVPAMRQKVKAMMLHAWSNYHRYAWGSNELCPITRRGCRGSTFSTHSFGATIIEALDTLHIMGLKKEYQHGRDWIEAHFALDNVSAALPVFELTSRLLGSMLSLYSLTGDILYRNKALQIADKIMPAFDTPTGIPKSIINLRSGHAQSSNDISKFGALHLELSYLSDITGNPVYRERVQRIRKVLGNMTKPNGLYPNRMNIKTGKWIGGDSSINRFHDYLLKSWLQSGNMDTESKQLYTDAILDIVQNLLTVSPQGDTYISDYANGSQKKRMDQAACFSGAFFAFGAAYDQMKHWEKYTDIGTSITETCHRSYEQTPTKLAPEVLVFPNGKAAPHQRNRYMLSGDVVESYLAMWRLTRDKRYRSLGCKLVQAIEKYCRKPHGYSGIRNVHEMPPEPVDSQPSLFLAKTLKYLFLLFSEDDVISLYEWVLNSGGHALPIKGENEFYRELVYDRS
ncbi:blast:Mannosyl-oligosaccharide alpha-1%2C2-mannosidase isoform A [Drosophila guanche]|uniref:alpha-1,2-Mannosidase n=1 Tax=Drosophila guanche TaxID=7266 RepID=A0A3B0JFL3_DROGU|nr:blast:Mannosyl-oligosaccharide alpha-1%2C2-mannosidase isoform A [Drosophila guanche]